MFRKKHTVKEVQAISKSDAKKLKASAVALVGDEFSDVLDFVWDKKGAVTKRRWQFGPGASVVLHLVNDLPLLISVDGLSAEGDELVPNRSYKAKLLPTIFLLLRARQYLLDDPARYADFVAKIGVGIYCRGPTSHFLLSGAHLMMPGILGSTSPVNEAGRVALIFSIGTPTPYAVGFTTSKFVSKDSSGAGVCVISCFRDSLWDEFEATFLASCTDKSGAKIARPVPEEFLSDEVLENIPKSPTAPDADDNSDPRAVNGGVDAAEDDASGADEIAPPPAEQPADDDAEVGDAEAAAPELIHAEETLNGENHALNLQELFPNEDAILRFAFCEGVKSVPNSLLPVPLTQFTAMIDHAYPRVNDSAGPIDFKNTHHKRALAFFKQFAEVIKITERAPGLHAVDKIHKSSLMVRDHNRVYKDFLAAVQKPALEREARAAELRMMEDKKTVFNQQILSVTSSYKPHRDLSDGLARILLEGNMEGVVAHETVQNFPSLQDLESDVAGVAAAASAVELPMFDYDLFSILFTRKTLMDNLRGYLKERGLLVVDASSSGKGSMPSAKLQGALAALTSAVYPDTIPLNQLEETILKRHFNLTTEIIIQTSVSGSSIMSEFIPARHIAKSGLPPSVNVWTEKRSGNKTITLIKNLEAFGFDLDILSRAWRQRFSTSCSVVDPSSNMPNLKSGTKIPLEIHVQGDVITKLSTVLTKELGIPTGLIRNSK